MECHGSDMRGYLYLDIVSSLPDPGVERQIVYLTTDKYIYYRDNIKWRRIIGDSNLQFVTDGNNLSGVGENVFTDTTNTSSGKIMNFRRIVGSGLINVSVEGNDIIVECTPPTTTTTTTLPPEPTEECFCHMSDMLIGGRHVSNTVGKIFVPTNNHCDIVGAGDYPITADAFPNSWKRDSGGGGTFDGMAVGPGVSRFILYSETNFQGNVILDISGPMVVNNLIWASYAQYHNEDYPADLQAIFPQDRRMWSPTNMNSWHLGSLKIECSATTTSAPSSATLFTLKTNTNSGATTTTPAPTTTTPAPTTTTPAPTTTTPAPTTTTTTVTTTLAPIDTGLLYSWGRNLYGELGLGNDIQKEAPVQVNSARWKMVSAGGYFSLAIDQNNKLWSWGSNAGGQLGIGSSGIDRWTLQLVDSIKEWKIVSAGGGHAMAIDMDNKLWGWGGNNNGTLGFGYKTSPTIPTSAGEKSWKMVSCGGLFTAAIDTDDQLWSWGNNDWGQLGIGGTINQYTPQQVGLSSWIPTFWKMVSCNSSFGFTLAIDMDDCLWSWGFNDRGQLGLDHTIDKHQPTRVGLSNWKMVSAGDFHSLAIDQYNKLWSWGRNNYGQLGLGHTTDPIIIPTQIGTANWKMISCGHLYSMAIDINDKLWSWGYPGFGALGRPYLPTNTPEQIGSLNWRMSSSGIYHTLAILKD